MKKRKQALFHSVIALLLCVSMLMGTTFAWFTDGVTSGKNKIVAGNLDVELEYMDAKGNWHPVEEDTNVFEENTLWEPGHTEVVYLRISNQGSLALRYQLGVNIAAEAGSVNVYGEPFVLSDYIVFDAIKDIETAFADRDAARAAVKNPKILSAGYTQNDTMEAGDDPHYVAFVVYMPEDVGNEANYRTGERAPEIALGINLYAAQHTSERDSFGSDYDLNADFPEMALPDGGDSDIPVVDGALTDNVTITGDNVSAEVPAGVQVESGATAMTLTVTEMETTGSNLTIAGGEVLKPVDVHVSGVSANNTTPIKVRLNGIAPTGLNLGNLKLYHVENGTTNAMTYVASEADFTAHNQFTYDPATGDVVLYMATFSEVSFVADTINAWNGNVADAFASGSGTEADPYIIANADQLAYMGDRVSNGNAEYGSAHYKLIADVNIGGEKNYADNGVIFYPIGYNTVGGEVAAANDDLTAIYFEPVNVAVSGDGVMTASENAWYTYGGAFKGVFDGTGHTVTGIYQNTWAMKGNYSGNYYNAAMGLFGYVYGGTVKNLTVDNFYSEGEFAPTGCVTAYAAGNATFENISITNSHPQTYNTGVAGIVGWDNGGDTEDEASSFTFKNITVDSTNTISALWGSWDVAAAGVLGYLGTHSKADFENCNVTAVIDVYNDVCGNYQYYWYRYCGMLIGTVDRTTKDANGTTVADTSGITAKNCKVNFGQWNDYYYCELVANSQASYTHDHQFSRLTPIENESEIFDGENWTRTGNFVVMNRDDVDNITARQCYHIVKDADGNLVKHEHKDAGTEVVDGKEVYKEDKTLVFLPFEQVFGGYGWGVKGWDVESLQGIDVTGISKENVDKSATKFLVNTSETNFRNGYAFTLDKFFKADIGVDINSANVYVSVSPLVEKDSTAGAVFVPDAEDWTKGTLTFSGTGAAEIIITDYDLCLPTRYIISVSDPVEQEKFDVKEDIAPVQSTIFEAEPSDTTFGTLFEEKDDALIVSENVTVTVLAPDGTKQVFTGAQWADATIEFAGYGDYTVTITDQDHCTTSTATLTIKEPAPVEKFTPVLPEEDSEPAETPCGDAIRLGELFSLNETYAEVLKQENITVTVKPVTGEAAMAVAAADDQAEETAKLFVLDDSAKNWEDWTLTILVEGSYEISITDQYFCQEATTQLNVAVRDLFEVKLPERNFLYRVGNQNAVSLGSLFGAMDGETVNSGDVSVTVEAQESSNVSGVFTANATDWTKGTVQFSGTGVVKVTIGAAGARDVSLELEVVDAVNATAATNATKNNVVLLNDCGFSSLEVSGGYTLYGNGFTMTCGSDSAALDMGYSFVTLNGGTLDNVQIICPNYDYAALYKSNLTSSENRSQTTDKTRYYNAKSGVMASGNSRILNSRISGGRASLNVSGGNVVVDNSRIELGAVASILVGAANSLTLRDVTLVQKPTASTHDSNKTLMGFSVLYLCDSDGNATPTTLEGSFVQQAWIHEADAEYVPSAGKDIVTAVLKETDYLHDIDGDGTNESLNLGFAYMPEDVSSSVAKPTNITDNRTDKATVPYEMKDVKVTLSILSTTVYVYSYKNTNGTGDSFKNDSEYTPNKQSDNIAVIYSDTADGLTTGKSYGTDGWVYELNVDLDKLSGYALDFGKLSMSVNGVAVTDLKVNGSAKPTTPVAVTSGGTTYTLTATIDGKEYTATYKVTGTETSKESPSLVASNYGAGLCVASSYGGTWHGAAPALEGIQIKYWSVAEKQYKTINLSDYTPTTKGKLNGTNTTWTYSPDNGDFTLTLTGGQVHSSNNVYAMPVVCNDKLYFVASSSNGLVNTGNSARTIPVSYTFKDNNNGDVLTFSHTWSVAENKDEQYKYSDFCNGTLTQLKSSGGGGCVTPDTLVTLADGSRKRIDQVTYADKLLVWDFYKGAYAVVPSAIIFDHGVGSNDVIRLTFSDGTVVKAVNLHQFFDSTLNRFVTIDAESAEQFVGHYFAKYSGTVRLVDYEVTKEYVEAWGIISATHYNIFVEGMLSTDFMVEDYGVFNYFEVGKGMKYDSIKMDEDIAKYGLYTYEDFADHLTYEQFVAFNVPNFKVAVGKGNYTHEGILNLIKEYLHN